MRWELVIYRVGANHPFNLVAVKEEEERDRLEELEEQIVKRDL